MPDFGGDWLTKSLFFNQAQQDTPSQGMGMGMGNTDPGQLREMLTDPQVQAQLQHFGIHFDPGQIRQSPFFGNQMMQGHPGIFGRMSGAMANAAATPEAPMVSGVGSGITRAMQGMMGGPEMLRQYQVNQMMAPMRMLGQMMPAMGEQRRAELEQHLERSDTDMRRIQDEVASGNLANQQQRLDETSRHNQETEALNQTIAGIKQQLADATSRLNNAKSEREYTDAAADKTKAEAALIKAQKQGQDDQNKMANKKPYSDLEAKKAEDYRKLEQEYSPYWNSVPGKGFDANTWPQEQQRRWAEFNQQKQAIEDQYGQQRTALGTPTPGYRYSAPPPFGGGNQLVAPTGATGDTGAPNGATHIGTNRNGQDHYLDAQGRDLGPVGGGLNTQPKPKPITAPGNPNQ